MIPISLDLGALVGRAIIDDGPFQRTYSRLMRQMAELGRAGEKTAASTATLDESLAATGKAATTAGAGIDRTTRASTSAAAAEDKAAAAASRHAQAVTRVAAIMDETATSTPRVQAATLRLAAAQERLNGLQESGVATTRQLASAQAGLIGAQRSLAAAQDVGAAATSRWRSGLMLAGKTALELGLLIGGIEIARKAIEFVSAGKHLTDALNSVQAASHATDKEMLAVRAQSIALGKDLSVPAATAIDAAQAIDDLVRSGMTLPRAMVAARAALLLAAAANVKTADSARVLGDVLDEFKLPASEATKTADILAAAATSSAGGLMAVFEAFTYVGTRARALGLGVKDIAAAIIDLSKAGIMGDRAGTGLAMMLQHLAHEAPQGQKALDDLGVKAWNAQGKFVGLPKVIDQLHAAQQRMGVGSKRFIEDISVAFGARAANAVAAFALRGREGYDAMYKRLSSGDVEKAAALMNRGAGAGFRQLSKEATAAGVAVYDKLEKPITSAVMWVGEKLPAAVSTAAHILGPFGSFLGSTLGTAWDLFIGGAKIVAMVLGPVVHLIDGLRTPLGMAATGILALWAAFRAGQLVTAGLTGLFGRGGLIDGLGARMLYAQDAATGAWRRIGGAATAAAAETAGAAAVIEGEAVAASGAVVASGERAALGWAEIAGPLVAVALGVALVVSMFHHSSTASKEATDAAKAYGDALKSGDHAELADSIVKQLSDNKVPELLNKLNGALGRSEYSGKQFADAIERGGKPLDVLRSKLQGVVSAFRSQSARDPNIMTKPIAAQADAASRLLKVLNTQNAALTQSQVKEIATYKALGMVAVSVDQVSSKLGIGSDQVKAYAGMLGLAVTKSGDLVNATKANQQAILAVSHAYDTASQSGNDFLTAEDAFSKSAGTAADRAALIGATLKSSNGDALTFAASMAATTTSVDALVDAFKSQRDQLTQQSRDQKAAAREVTSAHDSVGVAQARVAAAQARLNQVRANSKSTTSQLRSAEAALKSAQNEAADAAVHLGDAQYNAGKAGALAYADTERAALKFTGAGAKTKATIDTTAKGAGDLVAQLQAIQDSAVKAAGAMFQHQRSVESGTKAADDAYDVYVSKTRGVFIDSNGQLTAQSKQLHLTKDQAKALADQYLRTPAVVKTLIEAEGANPVVTVLNKIGKLLADLTGQQWDIPVSVNVHTGAKPVKGGATNKNTGALQAPHFASGGDITGSGPRGVDSVPIIGAPGEWMATVKGAALLRSLYGSAGMKAINLGRSPVVANIPSPVAARSVAMDNGPADGKIHIHGDFKQTIMYPEPEPVSRITPRALRMARVPLAGR